MANVADTSYYHQSEHFCKYIHRYCNQTRLNGYDYCTRHILEDKTAPFRQCTYVSQPNHKRCPNAASKAERNDKRDFALCPFHEKSVQNRSKLLNIKRRLTDNDNHLDKSDVNIERLPEIIVPYGSGNKPLKDNIIMENVDDDFTWGESSSHCLDNAGVYTHKEILRIAREKIIHLQQLYCDELRLIYHNLKEQRRDFLNTVTQCHPEMSEVPLSGRELRLLKETSKFHRNSVVERIFRRRVHNKRSGIRTTTKKAYCVHEKNGKKCLEQAIILTKYCKKHILSDPKQTLYRPCGHDGRCKRPVIPLESKALCEIHFHSSLIEPSKVNMSSVCEVQAPVTESIQESEPFESMDDIASLSLDDISPGTLFALDVFGESGEADDFMQIDVDTLQPPADILSESHEADS